MTLSAVGPQPSFACFFFVQGNPLFNIRQENEREGQVQTPARTKLDRLRTIPGRKDWGCGVWMVRGHTDTVRS